MQQAAKLIFAAAEQGEHPPRRPPAHPPSRQHFPRPLCPQRCPRPPLTRRRQNAGEAGSRGQFPGPAHRRAGGPHRPLCPNALQSESGDRPAGRPHSAHSPHPYSRPARAGPPPRLAHRRPPARGPPGPNRRAAAGKERGPPRRPARRRPPSSPAPRTDVAMAPPPASRGRADPSTPPVKWLRMRLGGKGGEW